MIDRKRTACFTGHRKIAAQDIQKIEKQLDEIIEKLYQKSVIFYGTGGSYGFESSDLDGTIRCTFCTNCFFGHDRIIRREDLYKLHKKYTVKESSRVTDQQRYGIYR